MTSLIAWLAVDQRQPSAIYIATDSRISFPDDEGLKVWDYARKVFAAKNFPEIFGYCGDALFPTQILGQITELIDSNLVFLPSDNQTTKLQKVLDLLNLAKDKYFFELGQTFILYGTKCFDPNIKKPVEQNKFYLAKIALDSDKKNWVGTWLPLPETSALIIVGGSGKTAILEWSKKWKKTSQNGTSRGVFATFCSSLLSKDDTKSGGAPQLVGIRRNTTGISFGIIYNNVRYYYGLPIEKSDDLEKIIWHNTLFEVCDGRTMQLKDGFQKGYKALTEISEKDS